MLKSVLEMPYQTGCNIKKKVAVEQKMTKLKIKKEKRRTKTRLTLSNSIVAQGCYSPFLFSLILSPILGENILLRLRRKHPNPTSIFPSPPFNQTLTKNILSFFLILLKIHPTTKHTLK